MAFSASALVSDDNSWAGHNYARHQSRGGCSLGGQIPLVKCCSIASAPADIGRSCCGRGSGPRSAAAAAEEEKVIRCTRSFSISSDLPVTGSRKALDVAAGINTDRGCLLLIQGRQPWKRVYTESFASALFVFVSLPRTFTFIRLLFCCC